MDMTRQSAKQTPIDDTVIKNSSINTLKGYMEWYKCNRQEKRETKCFKEWKET